MKVANVAKLGERNEIQVGVFFVPLCNVLTAICKSILSRKELHVRRWEIRLNKARLHRFAKSGS
jgi:hypothetical protein